MAKLSKQQFERLQDALLAAFPSQSALSMMLRFGMDENLDAVAGGGSLATVVFNLITWVDAQGRTTELLDAARKANAGNALLAEVVREIQSGAASTTAPGTKQMTATAARRAVVLTALSLEYRAVREHLAAPRETTHPAGTIYELGQLAGENATWEVALVEIGAGNVGAAIEAERVIERFAPEVVLFVGVAGGLKDVKLGDVVAATKVYGYESGKETAEGFRPRPELGMGAYALVQRARAETRKDDWKARVKGGAADAAEVYVGPIAAGEKVLASATAESVKFIRAHYGDALAAEMEGYGVMLAAHQRGAQALVVRGISDVVEGKSDADEAGWQPRAAKHAAAFAMQVLAKL